VCYLVVDYLVDYMVYWVRVVWQLVGVLQSEAHEVGLFSSVEPVWVLGSPLEHSSYYVYRTKQNKI